MTPHLRLILPSQFLPDFFQEPLYWLGPAVNEQETHNALVCEKVKTGCSRAAPPGVNLFR